ncbi:MAG TPA: protein kinase [Vicinamibacterales bacterium]|nr:protein kinase [Vicinamibacterales bacterium]
MTLPSGPSRTVGGTGIPDHIGRYQILERVGQGGMGVLYRGIDPVLDREVAIKVMIGDFADDVDQLRPRFQREARAIARLQHRHIVTVFEFAEDEGTPYIVMEFLRGTSLAARMKLEPPLTIDETVEIVAQLCDGLGYAHEQGIVHRDVKPGNIFLLADGSVKLLDFGIAKLTTSNLTRQGDVLGSPSYMSPEQIMGLDTIDGRSDVFSAGVVLYELLAGKRPFEGDTTPTIVMKILNAEAPALEALNGAVSQELAAVVARALAKDPAKRFSTATEFARELQAIRRSFRGEMRTLVKTGPIGPATLAGAAPAPPAEPQAAAPAARNVKIAAAAAAALVVVAAIVFAIGFGRRPARPDDSGARSTPAATDARSGPAGGPPAAPPATVPATSQKETAVAKTATVAPSTEPPRAPSTRERSAASRTSQAAAKPSTGAPPKETVSRTPAPAANPIAVTVSGAYPFSIIDGGRTVSAASTSHHLDLPAGRKVRLVAPEYSLNQVVTIEENADKRVDLQAPAIGRLTIRSSLETCSVRIGDRDLGYPPVNNVAIAAGSYQIDIVCPNGRTKSEYVNIVGGQTQRVIVQ